MSSELAEVIQINRGRLNYHRADPVDYIWTCPRCGQTIDISGQLTGNEIEKLIRQHGHHDKIVGG